MNVVAPAAYLDGLHLVLAGDTAQEGPESLAQGRLDERLAPLVLKVQW